MTPDFSKMRWQEAVRCCTAIPAAQRLVIAHIGATADPQGRNAWRSNDLVVEELGVSRDTVKRARAAAVRYGFMVVTRPAPRGAGNTKTTEYQLLMPADNPINRCSSAPISGGEIGAADAINRCKTTPEIGAAEGPPSVYPSVSSSGESARAREDDEPLDVPAVPDAHPLPEISPDEEIHVAEFADGDPDPEPPRGCDEHPNDDAGYTCRPCVGRAKAYKRWEGRQNGRFMAALAVYTSQQNAAREATKPAWRCNWCHDTGIVLMSDGTPGSSFYACNHDGTRRHATPEEISAYEQRAA